MNNRKRVSESTIIKLSETFCKDRADKFIKRVSELAKLNEIPRDDYLGSCSVIDGLQG